MQDPPLTQQKKIIKLVDWRNKIKLSNIHIPTWTWLTCTRNKSKSSIQTSLTAKNQNIGSSHFGIVVRWPIVTSMLMTNFVWHFSIHSRQFTQQGQTQLHFVLNFLVDVARGKFEDRAGQCLAQASSEPCCKHGWCKALSC